jgi:hypothetical protein
MLLHGLSVASELIIHYIGHIVPPPESAELLPYQCSLTRLVLFGNAAVKRTAGFCLEQRNLAKILLQNVVHLVLEYGETHGAFGPPIAPYAEILVAFLASQLETLDIRVRSSCKESFFPTRACLIGVFQIHHHLTSQRQHFDILKRSNTSAFIAWGVPLATSIPCYLSRNL